MVTLDSTHLRVSGALGITHLTKMELHVTPGTHGWAHVEGEAGPNALAELNGAVAGRELHIQALGDFGSEQTLFSGIIRDAELVSVGGWNQFRIDLISGTNLMDREKRSRTFQDVGCTYSQIAEQVVSGYSSGAVICTVGENKPLGKPLIQYRETDWAFLRRIASHMGGVVVPEVSRGLPRLWFGFPGRSYECKFPEDSYQSGIGAQYYALGGPAAGYSRGDFLYYDVKSSQNCNLGWYTKFKGQSFIIMEKHGKLERGELIFTYRLGRPGLAWGPRLHNDIISGMSLQGEVMATMNETVTLKLDIDQGWDPGGPYPYPWCPATGNMMYCMPQVGTRVALYFPNVDEKQAKVTSSVRTNGESCARMGDPSRRAFVTEHGKELTLYPGEMSLIGGGRGVFSMADKAGITMATQKKILMVGQSVMVKGKSVEIAAPRSEIVMDKIDMAEGSVKSGYMQSNDLNVKAFSKTAIEGMKRTPNPPYRDAPGVAVPEKETSFDERGWWGNIVFGAVVAVACVAAAVAVVATGGAALVAGAAIGAAMGAATVTTVIAVEDLNDKEVRSLDTAAQQILLGTSVGGITGYVGAFAMPYGVATMATGVKLGLASGMGMRFAASNAMEHMSFADRFKYSFLNPGAAAFDAVTGGLFTGAINYVRLGTAIPSQNMVNQFNATQNVILTGQAAEQAAATPPKKIPPPLTDEAIGDYLSKATNNPLSDDVILGLTGQYDEIARTEGYCYFQVTDEVWDDLVNTAGGNYDEVWRVNQAFIDEQIASGKTVLLSNDPSLSYLASDGSKRFFQRELDYLGQFFTFTKSSENLWMAVPK